MTVDDWKDLLPKKSSIIIWGIIGLVCLTLQGCYTQLAMFHPPQAADDSENFYSYSVARVRPNLSLYANDGAGQSLGIAYQMMYNRFRGFMGFGNRYDYYNPYYYGGIYNDYVSYNIYDGTYTVWIPGIQEKKQRIWTRDNKSTTTNLNTTRTNHGTSQSSNSGYSNSSNVSSTRSSSGGSSSSSSSSNSRTRVTKRN